MASDSDSPRRLTIIPSDNHDSTSIEQNLAEINSPLAGFLAHVGLPTDNLLSPIDERRKVIQSLSAVLEVLPLDERQKADYISKFTICVAMGLFDGALAYLWDETIRAIRGTVIHFDIAYFYSIASSVNVKYRGLSDAADISAVGEHDLLEICRRMGLLDDVNHRRLGQVNYFRNHASSAHPNEHNLSGIELLGFLENCLRYAIKATVEHSVVQVKRLLDNIREHAIPAGDYPAICSQIQLLPPQRVEGILNTLFGMFCDPQIKQVTLDNVRGLAPGIWFFATDDLRFKLGAKYGYFRANGDIPRKDRVQEFLNAVNGNSYKDEDSLGAELIEKLQFLRSAHYSFNNFYNEFPHAKSVQQSLPAAGIPKAAKRDFVKVICTCAIGNGAGYKRGVDEAAITYYNEFIGRFDDADIVTFVTLFSDHEFVGDLSREKARARAVSLCTYLRSKTKNTLIQNALDAIVNNGHVLGAVMHASDYKRAVNDMLRSVSVPAVA